MDMKALFKISYGMYLLTARQMGVDNGCIINTAMQVSQDPLRIAVSVQKSNKTHDMIHATGLFCISALTKEADFSFYQHFGMQSGADVDKFADFPHVTRTPSTIYRLSKYANMYATAVVTQEIDLGSHTLFIADITDAEVLSDAEPCTYADYHSTIKPKAVPATPEAPAEKKQWVCVVCGYVYEGEEVPDDYVCPWCKHGKADFEPLNP